MADFGNNGALLPRSGGTGQVSYNDDDILLGRSSGRDQLIALAKGALGSFLTVTSAGVAWSSASGITSGTLAAVANATPTTVTTTGGPSLYLFYLYNAALNYNAWALIGHDGTRATLLRTDSNTGNFAITVAGSVVQIQQNSGSAANIGYTILRITGQ